MFSPRDIARQAAIADLNVFIPLVQPLRVLGNVHKRVFHFWQKEDRKSHQLLLLPRDHQKSAMIGFRVAQRIIKQPDVRILYVSSTANLASKQLKFIKDILTSDQVRLYWPDLINPEEAKREKWTETEISVDHPKRKLESVRDPTIFTAGLTTNITGMHCDVMVMDDVVVRENAYTEEGREKVEQLYSLMASVESADAEEWVVGTRYHPRDLYGTLIGKTLEYYDEEGALTKEEPLFEVFQEQVEDRGDGTGQYIWPKQQRADGRWFGFDEDILRKKKTQYLDKLQFRAQYYNNPNDLENATISRDCFQYYDKTFLRRDQGSWYFKNKRLNVFAAIDFAFSRHSRSDYSALVVVGVDSSGNYFILDVERFRTDKISEYFEVILRQYQKWGFRKLRAECTVAQQVIVNDLKQNYIRPYGLAFSIEDYRPNRVEGAKEERIEATLQPRYENRQIWHYQGGHCQTLEDELVLAKPPHDDIKDALASCISICVPPAVTHRRVDANNNITFHKTFGGVS